MSKFVYDVVRIRTEREYHEGHLIGCYEDFEPVIIGANRRRAKRLLEPNRQTWNMGDYEQLYTVFVKRHRNAEPSVNRYGVLSVNFIRRQL